VKKTKAPASRVLLYVYFLLLVPAAALVIISASYWLYVAPAGIALVLAIGVAERGEKKKQKIAAAAAHKAFIARQAATCLAQSMFQATVKTQIETWQCLYCKTQNGLQLATCRTCGAPIRTSPTESRAMP
jgi:hypothetical protein